MGNCCQSEKLPKNTFRDERGYPSEVHNEHTALLTEAPSYKDQPYTTSSFSSSSGSQQYSVVGSDPILVNSSNSSYSAGEVQKQQPKKKAKKKQRQKSVRFDLPPIQETEKEAAKDIAQQAASSSSSSSSSSATSNNTSIYDSPKMAAEKDFDDSNLQENLPRFPAGLKKNTKFGSLLVAERKKERNKSSSTATMYLKNTLSAPDVDALIKTLAGAIRVHIDQGELEPISMMEKKEANIFDETKFPLFKEDSFNQSSQLPSVEQIYKFIHTIFHIERLSHECGILCLAYIERMMNNSCVRLRKTTWRRIVLGALILASKVWEDQAVWNVDFLAVFPAVTVKDLGRLEAKYLNLLSFSVGLKASVYARYYFELRELSETNDFPLKPLDKDGQKRLEMRSQEEEDRVQPNEPVRRSQSADFGVSPKSPPAVLN